MTTNRLTFEVDVDPKLVSVNLRFRNNSTIHPTVRRNQKRIAEAAKKAAQEQEWVLPSGPLGIVLEFTFGDQVGDGDNPIKRTIDALQDALEFNDSKIIAGEWVRLIGPPGIRVTIYETEYREGDPRAKKRSSANRRVVWDFDE